MIHYPIPPHKQEPFKGLVPRSRKFLDTEKIAKEVISIPVGPHLNLTAINNCANTIMELKIGEQ
jgi:dTDP-4-amino-4,6-dideoxygalactose transaminase